MTKKPGKVVKKKPEIVKENIHSMYNQEFRFPSLVTRLKNLLVDIIS
jgi:hypothetical protein